MLQKLFAGIMAGIAGMGGVASPTLPPEGLNTPIQVEAGQFGHRARHHIRPDDLPENWDEMSEDERRTWFQETRSAHFEEEYGVSLPENWFEMDKEDKQAWMEENVPDFEPPRFMNRDPKPELPENWDEMSDEEQKAWLDEQRAAHFVEQFGIEQPEGWLDMTHEERTAWFEENGIEPPKHPKMNGKRMGFEKPALPENWNEMSDEEKTEWKREHAPQGPHGNFGNGQFGQQ